MNGLGGTVAVSVAPPKLAKFSVAGIETVGTVEMRCYSVIVEEEFVKGFLN